MRGGLTRISRFGAFSMLMAGACPSGAQEPFVHNDTTFLLRDFRTGYHAVFIAAGNDTVWRTRVASDPGDMAQHKHVRLQARALEELNVRPAPMPADQRGRRLDRIGVKRLNGGWSLYAPSDWIYHRQMQVSGNWLVTNEMDGPLAHAIVDRPAPTDGEAIRLRCVSLVSHAMDPRQDTIDVRAWRIDPERGIELWEFRDAYGDCTYEAMAPLEGSSGLPVIVNHRRSGKAREFGFEDPGRHWIAP
ncbi:MAG: hypothetical protein IPF41_07655 [Flavobacteriales bacterium]|nr:hypothetical protein [Flavobacteriales bacterium]